MCSLTVVRNAKQPKVLDLISQATGRWGNTRPIINLSVKEGVRWYLCNFSSREFEKPSDLVKHVDIYTQEETFECPHCVRAFTKKSISLTHMKILQNLTSRQQPLCDQYGSSRNTKATFTLVPLRSLTEFRSTQEGRIC